MRLGQIVRPLRRVGIYVPGGMGAYPSSVLMNAIPARVAGVSEIVMVSPPSREGERPAVLAAAAIAGVNEVYRVGGAQAIAALAYGTASIRPVDKIVGPGNAWVQAAKRMVYGVTDIDKMAGPSEVLVIADAYRRCFMGCRRPHRAGRTWLRRRIRNPVDARRQPRCEVAAAIDHALEDLPRAAVGPQALWPNAAPLSSLPTSTRLSTLANRLGARASRIGDRQSLAMAPAGPRRRRGLPRRLQPGALGDYLAGPNHVLPTGGSARFASPLGAYDFLKRTSIIEASAGALPALGPEVARLARMEGFEAHARAIELRGGAQALSQRVRNAAKRLDASMRQV